jgi:hypothetical protein
MEDENNNSQNTELSNSEVKNTSKSSTKWKPYLSVFLVLVVLTGGFLLLNSNKSENETTENETYRFVNNSSALCSHDFQQNQLECVDVNTNQAQTVEIPSEYKGVQSIQPSHDGTRLLLSLTSDSDNTRYVVTDTNFKNPKDVVIPYDEVGEPYERIIWGNNSSMLLITKQVREENDADFLPAPLIVWNYDIATKEAKRIFKNGDFDEVSLQLIQVVGANDEYLFITQPTSKNWVATDTDPPAYALLAVRLDDGFVRMVNIEQSVKIDNSNKYASGLFMKYDPTISTFYINGQNQISDSDYQNYFAAARLVDSSGLALTELSRFNSQSSFYGATTTKGTLVADWSDESEGFNYSLVASPEETHELQSVSPDKDNTKFVIASLPTTE